MNKMLSLPRLRVTRYALTLATLLWPTMIWAASQPESNAGQAAVANPVAPAEVPAPALSLSAAEIAGEAALQTKVSFDMKHRILNDLLGDLQQQSGVRLTADAQYPAGVKRVTAHVKDVSLARVLNALTGLYGVVWTRVQPGEYRMLPPTLPKLRVDMLALGDIGIYRYLQPRVR